MLGSTALTAVLGAGVDNRDHDAVKAFVRSAADIGLSLLFIAPDSKVPVDLRTPQQKTKDNKAAQEAAREAGHRAWQSVKAPAGLALATSNKTVLDRYLKRYLSLYEERYPDGVPVNIAVEVGGSGLIVVDCDTAAQLQRFYDVALPDDLDPQDYPAPTVLTPGQRNADGDMVHSDGGHFYFTVPDELMPTLPRNMGALTWGGEDGFAVLWDRRYVLIPPSTRPEGAYEVLGRDYPVTDAPWLVEAITEAAARRIERATGNRDDDENASDLARSIATWAEATPWSAILEPLGWTMAPRADSCGCPVWTAPGLHASPKSATAHDAGCSLKRYTEVNAPLHLWTDHDAPPFTDDMGDGWTPTFSKLQAVALSSFEGGIGRAMDELGLTPDLSVDLDPDVVRQADPDHAAVGDGDFEMPEAPSNHLSASAMDVNTGTEVDPDAPCPVCGGYQMCACNDEGQFCQVCGTGDGIFAEDEGVLWHATDETDAEETGGHLAAVEQVIDTVAATGENVAATDTAPVEQVSDDPADLPADFGKKADDGDRPFADVDPEDVDPDVFDSKHSGVPRIAPFSHWRDMPPPEYIIDGLLEHGALSSVIGAAGIGKSTVVLDMLAHIALGKRWRGRQVLKTRVLYLPGEGMSGAVQRLRAWEARHELSLGRDFLLGDSIILVKASNEAWGDLAAYIARQEIGLVVFDTFARQSSGLEENSATDVGFAVRRYDKLKELTNAGVMVVHHTGKGDPSSGRGSSALNGALDSELLVRPGTWDLTDITDSEGNVPGRPMEVLVTKQKNAEQPEDGIPLMMVSHDLGGGFSAPVITGPNGENDPMQGEVVLARPRPEPVVETAVRIRTYLDTIPRQGATRAELVAAVTPDAYARSRKDVTTYWKRRVGEAVDRGLRYNLIETLTGTPSGSRYIPSFATGDQARAAAAAEITDAE